MILLQLSETKVIKSRSVYNVIELASEVSGFADILLVGIGSFFTLYYT